MFNILLWTFCGSLIGLSLSVFINLLKKELYNKELSKKEINGIIFIITTLSFLRGFTRKNLFENIKEVLF